ncbi:MULTISPECIES: hypothetical protein [Klebsiella/Raoultella group]|nr:MULTISPECIES: hypothetical protein [Klebsiella/Raoultella group]MDC7944401.1 hypothetical protein [Raoultella ornithinolytica]QQM79401.1 hypothetical protein JII91_22080 [Klebsiella quasipneumoniae]
MKLNAGTIRVLLGSTPKMGAGMNAQETDAGGVGGEEVGLFFPRGQS